MRELCAICVALLGSTLGACHDDGGASSSPNVGRSATPTPEDDWLSDEALAEECTIPTEAPSPAPASTSSTTGPRSRPTGEVSLLPSEVSLVAVGDSLTFGQASTHPGGDTSYPAVLGRRLGVPAINRGVPGHGTKDLPDVDYLLQPGKQNRLVVMVGTNDVHNGFGGTAAEIYERLAAYVATREAAGWLVTVNTPPRWLAASPSSDAVAMEYEGLIRRGFRHVADVAASPVIGRGSPTGPDRAFYGDENGHLNDAGYATLARIVEDSLAPRGLGPKLAAPLGVVQNKSLTGWFRDWMQCSALPTDADRPVRWLDIAGGSTLSGFDAYGRDRPVRISNAINGRAALRFNGPGSGFFLPQDRLTKDFVRSRELVISVVMNVEGIASASVAPWDNDGVISDGTTRLGMSVKQPNTVIAFTYDGTKWTSVEAPIPVGAPVVVTMRLSRGKLGLRATTAGDWVETPSPKIDSLSNVLRIGVDSSNTRTFTGLIADVVIRRSYCDATMAADDAYFRNRYGVR